MIKKAKGLSLILVLTLGLWGIFIFPCYPQSTGKLTIVTYYPSPYGVYNELRGKHMAIGDNYYKNSDYCWSGSCTNTIDSDADLAVEGNVGIGTTKPSGKLQVVGDGVVVGNPTGGNKGAGSINAQHIYVNGSEIGGGRGMCGFFEGDSCPPGYHKNTPAVHSKSITKGDYLGTVYYSGGPSASYISCCRTVFPLTTTVKIAGHVCSAGSCMHGSVGHCYGTARPTGCGTPSTCHAGGVVNPLIIKCYRGYVWCSPD